MKSVLRCSMINYQITTRRLVSKEGTPVGLQFKIEDRLYQIALQELNNIEIFKRLLITVMKMHVMNHNLQ